jgi:uncharacterized Rmd1/YagE family protein
MNLDALEIRTEQRLTRLEQRLTHCEETLETRLKAFESTMMYRVEARFIMLAYGVIMVAVFGIMFWKLR